LSSRSRRIASLRRRAIRKSLRMRTTCFKVAWMRAPSEHWRRVHQRKRWVRHVGRDCRSCLSDSRSSLESHTYPFVSAAKVGGLTPIDISAGLAVTLIPPGCLAPSPRFPAAISSDAAGPTHPQRRRPPPHCSCPPLLIPSVPSPPASHPPDA